MARKAKNDMTALETYASEGDTTPVEKKTNYNPKSLDNLQTNHRPKAPTKYMQVNVFEYEDYLYRMARYNNMTTTKYILSLIKKDAEEHAAEYEQLRTLQKYDKPYRESPNKKKDAVESL